VHFKVQNICSDVLNGFIVCGVVSVYFIIGFVSVLLVVRVVILAFSVFVL
jgi:hypothetical protein